MLWGRSHLRDFALAPVMVAKVIQFMLSNVVAVVLALMVSRRAPAWRSRSERSSGWFST